MSEVVFSKNYSTDNYIPMDVWGEANDPLLAHIELTAA